MSFGQTGCVWIMFTYGAFALSNPLPPIQEGVVPPLCLKIVSLCSYEYYPVGRGRDMPSSTCFSVLQMSFLLPLKASLPGWPSGQALYLQPYLLSAALL